MKTFQVSGFMFPGSVDNKRGRGTSIALWLMMLLLAFASFSCSSESDRHDHSAVSEAVKYTCPMHPNVVSDAPGTCPVCGMDLVPVRSATTANESDLMLTDSQIRLANVTTQKVSTRSVGQTVLVNGRLVENEELSEVISSRAAGRVEKLFVKETGRTVKKGEPLYQLYSETLLTLQREFLLAKDQYDQLGESAARYKSFLDAARRKLLLYGLTASQIEKLGRERNMQPTITFVSPTGGIVSELNVAEGQYVNEGSALMKIESIRELWVEAELYPAERSLVKVGDRINVRISGFASEPVPAKVDFLNPEYRANTQITIMRASLPNPDLKFTPGMFAQIAFSHSAKDALALPVDAVIRDANGAHVYVQRGRNTFRPMMVKTGLENFDQVEITEGLSEGDTVAVSGAYLLYSEIILKKGHDPMEGHGH